MVPLLLFFYFCESMHGEAGEHQTEKKIAVPFSAYVTGFAKRGLPHTFNLPTLTIYNFILEKANDLKFGQQ